MTQKDAIMFTGLVVGFATLITASVIISRNMINNAGTKRYFNLAPHQNLRKYKKFLKDKYGKDWRLHWGEPPR